MRQSSEFARQLSESDRQLSETGQRVACYLRAVHPQRTAENVAADTGLKVGTVAKWLERESAPNGGAMVILFAVYGPDFLGAVARRAPSWLNPFKRAAEAEALLADLEELRARASRVLPGLPPG